MFLSILSICWTLFDIKQVLYFHNLYYLKGKYVYFGSNLVRNHQQKQTLFCLFFEYVFFWYVYSFLVLDDQVDDVKLTRIVYDISCFLFYYFICILILRKQFVLFEDYPKKLLRSYISLFFIWVWECLSTMKSA